MTNEVEKTKGSEVSTNVSAGISSEFTRDDLQQGRLTLMQANSNLVKQEEQRQGSIIDLVSGEEHAYKGNANEPAKDLEFTICGIMKYWIEKDADSDDFIAKYAGTSANEKPWDENIDGRNIKRTFHYSYVVLLTSEIADGIEMPYELAFRSTAVKETKKLNSLIERMAAKGISSHKKVFKAIVTERKKGNDSWWGLDLAIARDADEKEEKVTSEHFASFIQTKEKFMAQQEDHYANAGTSQSAASTDGY